MSQQNEADKQADMDRVQKAIDVLAEHFDTVQIFVTRLESFKLDGTVNIGLGQGNWFTRYGQVKVWALKEEEVSRCEVRSD